MAAPDKGRLKPPGEALLDDATGRMTVAWREFFQDMADRDAALMAREQSLRDLAAGPDYVDDADAATGGVEIGQIYRTGSTLKVRVA